MEVIILFRKRQSKSRYARDYEFRIALGLVCYRVHTSLILTLLAMLYSDLSGLVDERIANRHSMFVRSLLKGRSISIQSISETRAEQIGNYRLLQNNNLTEQILIDEIKSRCSKAVKDRTVLCIHDSSEANFFHHSNRLRPNTGLGPIDAAGKKGIGFKVHNSIAVDAKSLYPYGLSNIKIWERDKNRSGTSWVNRKKPVKYKESIKWQEGCNESEQTLRDAKNNHPHSR
jgi:hypothetical protein